MASVVIGAIREEANKKSLAEQQRQLKQAQQKKLEEKTISFFISNRNEIIDSLESVVKGKRYDNALIFRERYRIANDSVITIKLNQAKKERDDTLNKQKTM